MKTPSQIRIHHHAGNAALSFEGVDRTIYLNPEQVRWLARKLNAHAKNPEGFNTYCWEEGVGGLTRQGTPADFVEVRDQQKPKTFTVITVSSNTNSFGYKSVLCLAETGEGFEGLVQAYGTNKVPVRGDAVTKEESRWYCGTRALGSVTPKQARAILAEVKGGAL